MNRINQLNIHLPVQMASHGEYISDQVRQQLDYRRWRGDVHIDHLSLGEIASTVHTTPDDIVSEIVARIDCHMEPYR